MERATTPAAGSNQPSKDQFLEDLSDALQPLSAVARRRQAVQSTRPVVELVGNGLWNAVLDQREVGIEAEQVKWCEDLAKRRQAIRRQVDLRKQIAGHLHDAAALMRTEGTFPESTMAQTNDLANQVQQSVNLRNARGPAPAFGRETLTEIVLMWLAAANLRPTSTGVTARVVSLVQETAGFGHREASDVARDIRRALNDPAFKQRLQRTQAQLHVFPPTGLVNP